ncbi:MAG: hypothetical protein ACRETF_05590 [Nevskiaceae bacterium]
MSLRAGLLLLACSVALGAGSFEVANRDIDELSGLAVSRADPAVLWGHNDTGGGLRLYRIGPRGEDLGAVRLVGAQSSDWEDIAAFEDAAGPALLIADTGDNFSMRSFVTLYAARDRGRAGAPELLWRLELRYPDGAHDCEAVAIDPLDRDILLVTKRDPRPRLYRVPLPASAPRSPQTAQFLGEVTGLPERATLAARLKAPLAGYPDSPTALDIARDGLTAVIVTTRHAYVYRRDRGTAWALAFSRPPVVLELPPLSQIEAAALSPDGRELTVGTEGRPGKLAVIALPQ